MADVTNDAGTKPHLVAWAEQRPVPSGGPARDPAAMPWALTRAEIEALAGNVLEPASVRTFHDVESKPVLRWIAEFHRK